MESPEKEEEWQLREREPTLSPSAINSQKSERETEEKVGLSNICSSSNNSSRHSVYISYGCCCCRFPGIYHNTESHPPPAKFSPTRRVRGHARQWTDSWRLRVKHCPVSVRLRVMTTLTSSGMGLHLTIAGCVPKSQIVVWHMCEPQRQHFDSTNPPPQLMDLINHLLSLTRLRSAPPTSIPRPRVLSTSTQTDHTHFLCLCTPSPQLLVHNFLAVCTHMVTPAVGVPSLSSLHLSKILPPLLFSAKYIFKLALKFCKNTFYFPNWCVCLHFFHYCFDLLNYVKGL